MAEHSIRFDAFELNPRSGELLRQGRKVKLQNQPFKVLLSLVERAGEPVSREELRRRLWPEKTFVDFDHGLNKAINALRRALRDSAKTPRFIETLPQRGYRFLVPVEGAAHRIENARIASLAVLPLENLSGDPSEGYFSDGMTEELICAVARIDSVRVISRTSVMSYKGQRKPLPLIARELGVEAIVEGSAARSGGKVRITAQLIRASDDCHLWAGRYERELSDVLRLQAEIAHDIASRIQALVDPAPAPRGRIARVNPQAYEARLKGNHFREKLTPADLERSIAFYHQALQFDPHYAIAHADLAQAYFMLGVFGVGPSKTMFPKAREHALQSLELDDTVAIAYSLLALIHVLYDWDWPAAEAKCRRAAELYSNDQITQMHLADYLSITGRHREAIDVCARGMELNPISHGYRGFFSLLYYRGRCYEQSIEQARKALEIAPGYSNALWFMALSLEQQGRKEESAACLEEVAKVSKGSHHQALLSRAYSLIGRRNQALDILEELKRPSAQRYVSPFDFAVIYCGLEDLDTAFDYFEEAYRERVFRIIELTLPMFDGLRGDPRWQSLVKRAGLAL